jgi:ribonucleoside-triphosphate reductase
MENLVHKALRIRHERLLGTKSDVSPIHWQDGAIARLNSNETIDKLLYNNYSTISIGYAGLYEAVYYMKHCSHTSEEGREFGLRIMQFLNDKADKWKAEENIGYSVYGTPLESTTYKFAKCLQNRFGIVPNVTDHNYITNSYHICVREDIDAFSKLEFETELQKLSTGGAISYIEVGNMQKNLKALEEVVKYIYENVQYAEFNTKSDYCQVCGFDGEIIINKDNEWECPNCGNKDRNRMNVTRRTCGYLGEHWWNEGKTKEIKDRVVHLDNIEDCSCNC